MARASRGTLNSIIPGVVLFPDCLHCESVGTELPPQLDHSTKPRSSPSSVLVDRGAGIDCECADVGARLRVGNRIDGYLITVPTVLLESNLPDAEGGFTRSFVVPAIFCKPNFCGDRGIVLCSDRRRMETSGATGTGVAVSDWSAGSVVIPAAGRRHK